MRQAQIYFLLFYCRELHLLAFQERSRASPSRQKPLPLQGTSVRSGARRNGAVSSCTITCAGLCEVSFRARTDGCGSAWPPFSNRIRSASSVRCQPCPVGAGAAAVSETGQELFSSSLHNKSAAFRNILDQGLDLLFPL